MIELEGETGARKFELAEISDIVKIAAGVLKLGLLGGVGKLKVLKTREDSVDEIVEVVTVLHSWETE